MLYFSRICRGVGSISLSSHGTVTYSRKENPQGKKKYSLMYSCSYSCSRNQFYYQQSEPFFIIYYCYSRRLKK